MTWLFGGFISATVHNRLTRAMRTEYFEKGEAPAEKDQKLYLISMGSVELKIEEDVIETLQEGEFCGEAGVLFSTSSVYNAVAATDVKAFVIERSILLDMPVVRWKLFETYKRRMETLLEPGSAGINIFQWKNEYAIGVDFIDWEHKRMFEAAEKVFSAIQIGKNRKKVCEALEKLAEKSRLHFESEEDHFRRRKFPDLERHAGLHTQLMLEIEKKCELMKNENYNIDIEFLSFLKRWILEHIMSEDMRFKEYMNS
jgi:hemerythrin